MTVRITVTVHDLVFCKKPFNVQSIIILLLGPVRLRIYNTVLVKPMLACLHASLDTAPKPPLH